jgi:hypothetical protein
VTEGEVQVAHDSLNRAGGNDDADGAGRAAGGSSGEGF